MPAPGSERMRKEEEKEGEEEDVERRVEADDRGRELEPYKCKFYLHFRREGRTFESDGLWVLDRTDRLNSVSVTCAANKFPKICRKSLFLEFFTKFWVEKQKMDRSSVSLKEVEDMPGRDSNDEDKKIRRDREIFLLQCCC